MLVERMPPLEVEAMDAAQQEAAAELSAGPRGGVRGPFVPLLRSPELMRRLQKVGEYLRYHSALEPRLSEFAMLLVARHWTQQFEWAVHRPLAIEAGLERTVADQLAQGRRPEGMKPDEALAYDLCDELFRSRGLCERSYDAAIEAFGERGLIDLLALLGYFVTVSMVMNVAHTPAPVGASAAPLPALPL